MHPKASILNIPLELLIEILKCLDYRTVLNCSQVCKEFHQIIKDSLELQYKIELEADGMIDGPRTVGSWSTSERLQLLLDRRARWRTLDWTRIVTLPLVGFCHAYELVGGVFAKTMGVGDNVGARHLTVASLPTRYDDGDMRILEDLGVTSRDFAIDPSQDLITLVDIDDSIPVNVRVTLHLRTISTNTAHKQASKPALECRAPGRITSCFIQIVDDIVGMFFWLQGPTLMIWNWRTGRLVVHCVADYNEGGQHPRPHERALPQLPQETWDFAFLSSRAFLLNSIHGRGFVHLFSFDGNGDPEIPPTLHATLTMPALEPPNTVHHFATHSAPFLGGDSSMGKPFTTDESSRIYMMTITYGQRARFHLFVKSEFLMSFFPSKPSDAKKGRPPMIDWKDWGPTKTRFIENDIHYQWLRYVHGHRAVMPPIPRPMSSWPISHHRLCVFDFKVHPTRLHDPCKAPSSKRARYHIVTIPTLIERKELFKERVETRLPYSVSSLEDKFNYSGFMIDEERLIGMKSSSSLGEGDLSKIDIFTF
ncbi:unnamed protein product [Somion occarium]